MTRAEHACICAARSRPTTRVDAVDRWIDLPLVGLMSINDHTPGQRQFLDPSKLKQYYMGKFAMTEAADRGIPRPGARAARAQCRQAPAGDRVACPGARRCRIASHDDATRRACARGGAERHDHRRVPDHARGGRSVARGGAGGAGRRAQPGAAAARIPATSPPSIWSALGQRRHPVVGLRAGQPAWKACSSCRRESAWRCPQAVAAASLNPARAVGLNDRGEIAPGKRADLVRVRVIGDAPVVRAVWREGERVV